MSDLPLRTCRLCAAQTHACECFVIERAPRSVNELPAAGAAPGSATARLALWECPCCGHFQLAEGCEPPTWRAAVTAAGLSAEMRAARAQQFAHLRSLARDLRVLEIGAGEGLFLPLLADAGLQARGMEWSTELVERGRSRGADLVAGHPLDGSLRGVQVENFACINFLEHATRPVEMLREIRQACAPDAVGLIEVPDFGKDLALDRSHDLVAEHLSYFTARTLRLALELAGFEVLAEETFWHGDDIVAWVRPRSSPDLRAWKARDPAFALFSRFCAGEASVAMWGASHQALTLLGMCDTRPGVTMIADSSPRKQGRMDPAWGIPIVSPDTLLAARPDKVLIMAAGYSDEVARTLRARGFTGEAAILADGVLRSA